MSLLVVDVCAAVIYRQRRFLLATRPAGKHLAEHWEFPGGKIHPAETLAACIIRELREELSITVRNPQLLATLEHDYPEKRIRLHFLACELPATQLPHPQEGQQVGWFERTELEALQLAPADRRFITHLVTGGNGVYWHDSVPLMPSSPHLP